MLEARITKAVVVHKGLVPHLMGVAEYYDEMVNFTCKYDWENLDTLGFLADLREQLAKDFDLPVYRVDIREGHLLQLMKSHDVRTAQ